MKEEMDYKLLLDTAVLAGKLMLSSGAEIYRVEDTICRILDKSGFKTREAFVMSTGFMVTLDDPKFDSMTVVRRVYDRDTNLYVISMVNTVSREFCSGQIDLKTAFHRLEHMETGQYTSWQKDLAAVGVSAMFAVVFGGAIQDVFGAAVAGVLLVLIGRLSNHLLLNGFMQTMLSSAAMAAAAAGLAGIPSLSISMDMVIVSAIMPIVPGAAITTALRDTLQGDYVSGGAKALEAFVKAAAIAIGVGFGIVLTGGGRLWMG